MPSFLDSQILQLWAEIQELQSSLQNPDTKDSDRMIIESKMKIAVQALQDILEVRQALQIDNACHDSPDTQGPRG